VKRKNHQLSAVFNGEPSAIDEAVLETDFQKHLKWLDGLPDFEKQKRWEKIQGDQ